MDVAININEGMVYPSNVPFHPIQLFPELRKLNYFETDNTNSVYSAVRDILIDLGYDRINIGTENWNPLSEVINKGDRVVVKPNLVLHHNGRSKDIEAVVTNASVIRPILDYAILALDGTGEIIVADAPHGDANFDVIVKQNGLRDLIEWYVSNGFNVQLRDLRKYYYPHGFSVSTMTEKEGDIDGYTEVVLSDNSYLTGLSGLDRLYGSDYNRSFIVKQHKCGVHKYLISNTLLMADVVISVPKLKTHKKTGVTINLKNLVGINGNKNYLAHYRIGCPKNGGDEYNDSTNIIENSCRLLDRFIKDKLLAKNTKSGRLLYNVFLRPIQLVMHKVNQIINKGYHPSMGNWYGNDTCWRMCLDLNYILRFCDKKGRVTNENQRQYLCLVDGIVAGEGDGPMQPTPKPIGLLCGGSNPYYTDFVCAHLMGFDPLKLKVISEAFNKVSLQNLDYKKISVVCNRNGEQTDYKDVNFRFEAQDGWKGHIERN